MRSKGEKACVTDGEVEGDCGPWSGCVEGHGKLGYGLEGLQGKDYKEQGLCFWGGQG